MRQGLLPICIVCAVTATSSRKNFDKPSIATEKSFCNSKGVHSRSKQCFMVPFWNTEAVLQAMSLYIQRPLPCKSLLSAAQTRCSASCRCRLRIFAKCSFSFFIQFLQAVPLCVQRPENTHGIETLPCVLCLLMQSQSLRTSRNRDGCALLRSAERAFCKNAKPASARG